MYDEKFIEHLLVVHTDHSFAHRDFRPQAVVAACQHEEVIIVKSKKGIWNLPQEGMRRGETLEEGAMRCLAEELLKERIHTELGIDVHGMTKGEWANVKEHLRDCFVRNLVCGFYWGRQVIARRPREGFFGKEYFYVMLDYIGERDAIQVDKDENKLADWQDFKGAIYKIQEENKGLISDQKLTITKKALKILKDKGRIK